MRSTVQSSARRSTAGYGLRRAAAELRGLKVVLGCCGTNRRFRCPGVRTSSGLTSNGRSAAGEEDRGNTERVNYRAPTERRFPVSSRTFGCGKGAGHRSRFGPGGFRSFWQQNVRDTSQTQGPDRLEQRPLAGGAHRPDRFCRDAVGQRHEGRGHRKVVPATREEQTSEGAIPQALSTRNKADRASGGTKRQGAEKARRRSTAGRGKPSAGRFPLPQASWGTRTSWGNAASAAVRRGSYSGAGLKSMRGCEDVSRI